MVNNKVYAVIKSFRGRTSGYFGCFVRASGMYLVLGAFRWFGACGTGAKYAESR